MRIPTLVLRKFVVNPNATTTPCIEISGRPSGLVAWVLTLLQLSTETHLTVTDLCTSIKSSSLSGEFTHFIPLPHVSSTTCGFSKPIGFLVAAAAAIFFCFSGATQAREGGFILFLVGLVIGGVFVVCYFLSRKITFSVITDSGLIFILRFKPSVLDGVPVNIETTRAALDLLNQKVLNAA
jgi:hypothetical protein